MPPLSPWKAVWGMNGNLDQAAEQAHALGAVLEGDWVGPFVAGLVKGLGQGDQKVYNSRRPYRDSVTGRLRRKYPDLPTSCEACGEDRILEVAHKPGFERKGAWRVMSNTQRHMIWILCPTCHKLIDRGICVPRELGLD